MIDELRRRSVHDVEQTSARPMPKEINVGELVVVVIVVAIVAVLVVFVI